MNRSRGDKAYHKRNHLRVTQSGTHTLTRSFHGFITLSFRPIISCGDRPGDPGANPHTP